MPFVDLNALNNSADASDMGVVPVTSTTNPVTAAVDPASTASDNGSASSLPPLPPLDDAQLGALPAVSFEPVVSTPATTPVQEITLDQPEPNIQAISALAGTVEFSNPTMAAANNSNTQTAAQIQALSEPVIETMPVPEVVVPAPAPVAVEITPELPPVPAIEPVPAVTPVVVTPVPAPEAAPIVDATPAAVEPVETPIVEAPMEQLTIIPAAAPVPVIEPAAVLPTVEVEVAPEPEVITPVSAPAETVVPTPVAEVPPMPAEASVSIDAPVVPDVVSFSSTADAEDPDKPAVVKSPEIKLSEDVEIKAEQGGVREIVGPGFDEAPATPLQEIGSQSIDQKLNSIGNMLSQPVVSSTPVVAPAPVADVPVVSETPTVPEAAPTSDTVPQPMTIPPVMSDPVTMGDDAMDALDINSLSSAPEMPVEALTEAIPQVSPVAVQAAEVASDLSAKTYDLNEMLVQAINMKASDLHLTVGYRAMARVDGKLTPIKSNVLDQAAIVSMVSQVIVGREKGKADDIRDYDLSYKLPDGSARFRVNIFRQQGSTAAVFRLIPAKIPSIETLKLPPVIKEFTKFSSGLVLFTGPTGSGKSTTIAALLNEINNNEPKHVITIEDPVEYVYPKGIALMDQREIYTDTDNWTDALRSVLRQDPDVVLIGEMRDLETIQAAIRVAETGHLVFATLHTNSAAQSIDRIIDVFPEGQQSQIRTQLASVIQAIVSQRLIPISGGGRRVSPEILIATPAVRNAIRDDKVYQIDNMIQTSAELGMITMEKSLVGLVREGLISTEVAQEYSNKPADVLTLLGANR